jgi:hypothetical protein
MELFNFKYTILILYIIIALIFTYYIANKKIYENFNDTGKYDLVVSRYNEDVDWLKTEPFNQFNIILYNKGPEDPSENCESDHCRIINLENVGRENHTFLYHIINNYDNLGDVTIFLPGSCNDPHKFMNTKIVIDLVNQTKTTVLRGALFNDIPADIYDFKIEKWEATNEKNKQLNGENKLEPSPIRPFGAWFEENFGKDVHCKVICYFGIFAVSKEHIRQHPKEYYEKFIKYLDHHSNPEVGHYMERSWGALFAPYPDSCIYSRDEFFFT